MTEAQRQARAEQRLDVRRKGTHSVWISLAVGMPVREFVLWNESEGGAKLSPRDPGGTDLAKIPDVFFVYMSADAAADSRRRCQVVWRTERHVGIKFLPNATRSSAPLRPPADVPAAADQRCSAPKRSRKRT